MADVEDESFDDAEDEDHDSSEVIPMTREGEPREGELMSNFRNVAGERELLSDLKNVVNKPESSDVAFICNDGIRVYACRWLLGNRCAVFKSMLSNGMLETRLSEIQLEKFSSPVMLAIMESLYTGTILSWHNFNWKMGFELISAAQFFIIPQVEKMAQKALCLHASCFHRMRKSVLMDKLNVAVEYPEPWQGKDTTLQKLIDHIGHDWFEEDCSHNLSRSAVEYILSTSKHADHQGESEPSMEEYFTFRKIVLWHAYQVVSKGDTQARTAIQNALPGDALTLRHKMLMTPADIDDCVSDASFFMDSGDPTMGLNSLAGTNICNDSLQKLLQYINLSRIPVSLLLKVIHPLNIFPPRQLLKALVHLALHKRVQYSVSGADWKHGPSLRVCDGGQIVCRGQTGDDDTAQGIAIAFVPMPRPSDTGIYEWSFKIIENDCEVIDVGFICQAAGQVFGDEMLKDCLDNTPSTRVLRSTAVERGLHVRWGDPECGWEYVSKEVLEVNAVVSFKLNVSERTCQVRWKDCLNVPERTGQVEWKDRFEKVWEDLPGGLYYPAVGFEECNCARVQLRLDSGFDSY